MSNFFAEIICCICFCDVLSFVFDLQCKPDKPVFLMTWEGNNPKLPSVLLNSHIDVVPVFPVSFLLAVLSICGYYAVRWNVCYCPGSVHLEHVESRGKRGKQL